MKLKLLLFALLLSGGILRAQDTIKTLIISEIRLSHHEENFVEITNIGEEAVQLSQFEFGLIRPWNNVPWIPEDETRSFMLPEKELGAGESFVMATVAEFNPKKFREGSDDYREKVTKDEIWTLADHVTHIREAIKGEANDSVDTHWWTWETQNGRGTYFIKQHMENDSVVVDQAGGVFDGENGLNNPNGFYDVAGVTGATGNSILVRKFDVKEGNLEFVRGIGADDSEWIPVPIAGGAWRDVFWTLGNHGDYNLDANTLESEVINIDFGAKTLTVPWGIRSNDDIMLNMTRKDGVAWKYEYSPSFEDSLHMSVRTGDKLSVMVCGNDLDMATFDIIAMAPATNANIVIPKYQTDPQGNWRDMINEGEIQWPRVTRHESGADTITGARNGIPYATRVDSLLAFLEKAPNASWEIIFVDGVERADLKDGDKLKVTAENGDEKEYVIQVRGYRPGHNALLASITWPDIPEDYRDFQGWTGDTIPGFNSGSKSYKIEIPEDVEGIPALIAKTVDLNAKVEVTRPLSVEGTIEERTMTFKVTADDDTTTSTYTVEFVKQKAPEDIQPYYAEPFISQFVFWIGWSNTNLWEIANPGSQPLDLSKYMIVGGPSNNPSEALLMASEAEDWADRYRRYVPGYKWVGEDDWAISPSTLEIDLNVSPIVPAGDVFVLGALNSWAGVTALSNIDIDFAANPWDEAVGETCASNWTDQNFFIFKILNDSITRGEKPATDINDFELIESWGTGESATPYGWFDFNATVIRKPEFTEGKPGFKESFGEGWWHTSEWHYRDAAYYAEQNIYDYLAGTYDIGKHYMFETTRYKSTVTSRLYKVSKGFEGNQTIEGVTTNTNVATFYNNIVKADAGQTLKVHATADGSEMGTDAMLNMNDTLIVLSADSVNTTKYVLSVTDDGLSSDALLTSAKYAIDADINAGTGSVSEFELGTTLRTVIENITVPLNASMQIINDKGEYVSMQMLNFDSVYVNVIATSNIYIEIVAEDATTKIVYQLLPEFSTNNVFLTSSVYSVSQNELLIDLVPVGTNVSSFLNNLIPSTGATIKLVDKNGLERLDGYVVDDDKVVVTSANGMYSNIYFISRLKQEYVAGGTYLAYILSNNYAVDQLMYKVDGVPGDELVADFLTKITTAEGAEAMIIDTNGNEKTSGDIDGADKIMVTSADGRITVYYTFGTLTAADAIGDVDISIYPNPTNSDINISGVKSGYRIQVYNSSGTAIRDMNAGSSIERISMGNQPAGMYLIVVSDNNLSLGKFKVIKH